MMDLSVLTVMLMGLAVPVTSPLHESKAKRGLVDVAVSVTEVATL
jgi:hypothetical protein